ncbi:MAG TPA: nitrate- and nitrite sensing domain-containing protein, partial [Catenuloplanes sp.]
MGTAAEPSDSSVPHHRRRRTDEQAPPRRRSRLRIADWRMRTKLATVLIIPSVAFVVLAGAQTYALAGQSSQLSDFAEEVSVGRQITELVHQLQVERDRSIGELAAQQVLPAGSRNPSALTATMRAHYEGVDAAVSTFRLAAAPLSGGRAAWRVSYGRTDEALGQRSQLRASVAAGAVSPTAVSSGYGAMIDALINLLAQPSPGLERPELTDAVLRYVDLARVKEVSSRLRAKLYQAASAGKYGPTDLVELSDLRAQQLSALAEFRSVATDEQLRSFGEAAQDSRFRAATDLEESTLSGATVLPAPQWWQASGDRQDLLRSVEVAILDDAVRQADNRSSAQLRQTLLVAGVILTILVVALITSVAIGRSIARSLRSLREHALRVARADLPDTLEQLRSVTAGVPDIEVAPAPVHSLDEVGEVADAFLAVHRSAVKLAVEQAVMRRNVNSMFVNLARRSQVLVERQLELLDELERDQADPDQLENLFKIDHLAARMRRNDESLLVLAGNESNRRWSEPVPLSTVVLAAIAEIEFYPRIQHDTDDDLHVVGHAVADLVHLLAELLENATLFSPPHTVVSLTGRAFNGGVAVLEITDEGLGMTPRALREANHLLSSPPAADVAASERMGLFVVSHLAARQGIRVQLRAAERGLVATVWLPRTVLADPTQHLLAPASAIMPGAGDGVVPGQLLPPISATAPMYSGVADRPAIAAAPPLPARSPLPAGPAVSTALPPAAAPAPSVAAVPVAQWSPLAARPSTATAVPPTVPA